MSTVKNTNVVITEGGADTEISGQPVGSRLISPRRLRTTSLRFSRVRPA
ncbi:MAG: hypothetical protein QOD64_2383 [Verrucomicrobiota bacterium]|jgi:hypothetical protein